MTTSKAPALRAVFLLMLIAPPLAASAQSGALAQKTREVSELYLALDQAGQLDALLDVYAADATFHDPTGDVFQGPVSQGPVTGAETIVAMQKNWGLAEQAFEVDASFAVGEYALHRGTLTVRYTNGERRFAIPFVTVHRVVEGRIAERIDFGEYIETFGLGDGYDANTASTRAVADRALRAYLDGDLETTADVADPEIQFQDPTSKVYGPPSGELYQGRDELLRRRAQIYKSVTDFNLEVDKSFVANHHAVYMGTTTYTTARGMKFRQPAVFVFEVRDGKVTRQWDFVDYTVGPIGD